MASARKPAFSARDNLQVLLQNHSVREVAKILGVDRRTIQRRKNQGATPTPENAKTLQRAAGRERGVLKRQAKRQGIDESGLAVPLPAKRQSRIDPRNAEKHVLADTVIFDIRQARDSDVVALLASHRGKNRNFRLIYQVKAGQAGESVVFKFMPAVAGEEPRARRESAEWEPIDRFRSDADLAAFIASWSRSYKLLYLVITLPKREMRRRKVQKK